MGTMKLAIVFSLGALAAVNSEYVCAQHPGGGGWPAAGGAGGGRPTSTAGKMRDRTPPEDIGAPVQVQLDRLEDDLKLTAQQRGAWNIYADKVLRFADDMTRARFEARTSSVPEDTTAAQQLDRLADKARNRSTGIEDIAESGKTLYALLSPEQRAIADRRLVLPMLSLANGLPPPGIGTAGLRGDR